MRGDRYSEREVFNAGGASGGDDAPARKPVSVRSMGQYSFTGETEPQQALPRNLNRSYLIVQNVGAVNLFLGFGAGAKEGTGILIIPGGNYLADYAVPTDSIYIYFAGGAAERCIICEGVRAA